jgi:molecular chaperone GrpE
MAEKDKREGVIPENGEEGTTPAGIGEAQQELIDNLKAECDNLNDRLLRKQAEFENFRKRIERERAEYVQFASSELMRELLGALDSFDLAIRNASASGTDAENMLQGFELIYKQLLDTLGRFGLKPIETKGQVFDPNFHQAVSTQATDEIAENTVVEEFRKGYVLNGRLLRPAMVSVSVKK